MTNVGYICGSVLYTFRNMFGIDLCIEFCTDFESIWGPIMGSLRRHLERAGRPMTLKVGQMAPKWHQHQFPALESVFTRSSRTEATEHNSDRGHRGDIGDRCTARATVLNVSTESRSLTKTARTPQAQRVWGNMENEHQKHKQI